MILVTSRKTLVYAARARRGVSSSLSMSGADRALLSSYQEKSSAAPKDGPSAGTNLPQIRPHQSIGSADHHHELLSSSIEAATKQALLLLQNTHLTRDQIKEANEVLRTLNALKAKSAESITASLRLLAFLSREGFPGNHLNGILHRWRSATVLAAEPVPHPTILLKSMRAFNYDVRSFGILASVHAWLTPVELKHVVVEQYMQRIAVRHMKPDLYMYHQLLRAWKVSGHDDAGECMMGVFRRMEFHHDYDVSPTAFAYKLGYWSREIGENEVDVLLERMESGGDQLNVQCFTEAIHLYAEICKPWKGETLLRDLMRMYPKCHWKIVWCAVRLIKSYGRSFLFDTHHMGDSTKAVEKMSQEVLEACCKRDKGLAARVQGAVIEYYTEAGMYDAANEMFKHIQRPGIAEYCNWVRALGRADMAAAANEVLRDKMPSRPLDAYNAALDAWLHSTAKNTGSVVRRLWKQIKSEGLQPRPEDYLLYLEILAKWPRQSIHADSILSEMRERGMPLDVNHYHYVIQACVMSRDWQRCRSLLLRMSQEGIYPTADTYSDYILPYCDVHRAEELLARMKGKIVTCDSYHSVMVSWMRKPTRATQDKVYDLYQTMRDRGIKPDNETYSILINYFVKRDLPRSLKLLQDLEDYDDINADYSHYNPIMELYLRNQEPLRAAEILLRRAEAYLRQDNHDDIIPLPDNIHDVFIALIRADELPAASWLLGRLHYMPLVTFELTYKMMMDAWALSDSPDKKSRIGRIKSLLKDVEVRKSDESMRPQKISKDDILARAIERFDFDSLFGKPPGQGSSPRDEGDRKEDDEEED